jgi:hypothetical protein
LAELLQQTSNTGYHSKLSWNIHHVLVEVGSKADGHGQAHSHPNKGLVDYSNAVLLPNLGVDIVESIE